MKLPIDDTDVKTIIKKNYPERLHRMMTAVYEVKRDQGLSVIESYGAMLVAYLDAWLETV